MGNRLFTELRDNRGIAYDVSSFYQPMIAQTAIVAVIVTEPKNYRIAWEGIVAEFKRFVDQPVSIDELKAAQNISIELF
jgi:zinc protease